MNIHYINIYQHGASVSAMIPKKAVLLPHDMSQFSKKKLRVQARGFLEIHRYILAAFVGQASRI